MEKRILAFDFIMHPHSISLHYFLFFLSKQRNRAYNVVATTTTLYCSSQNWAFVNRTFGLAEIIGWMAAVASIGTKNFVFMETIFQSTKNDAIIKW